VFGLVMTVVRRGGWLGLRRGNGVVAVVKEWRFQRVKWRLTAPGGRWRVVVVKRRSGRGKRREMKTTTAVAIHRMQRLCVIEVTRYLLLLGEYGSQVHEFSLAPWKACWARLRPLLSSSPVRSAVSLYGGLGNCLAIAECAWNATASWSCCHLNALHAVRK
jgi:hypothetical protein